MKEHRADLCRRRALGMCIGLVTIVFGSHLYAGESMPLRAAEAGLPPGFCPALRVIVEGAETGFVSLRGKARPGGENVWEGNKRLPSAAECMVFGGTPSAYVCTLYAGDVEENADGAYARAASSLEICLPPDWKRTERADGEQARTTVATGPRGPSVRVVSRDASGDAYVVELWVDAARP